MDTFKCSECGCNKYKIKATPPVRNNPSHDPKGSNICKVCRDCGHRTPHKSNF